MWFDPPVTWMSLTVQQNSTGWEGRCCLWRLGLGCVEAAALSLGYKERHLLMLPRQLPGLHRKLVLKD